MAVPLAGAPAMPRAWRWPSTWAERERLLERQHDRLEALLNDLLVLHQPQRPHWSAAEAKACDGLCRRLLWHLRLHLRLEERWLAAQGCLCPGHRAAHADAARGAIRGLLASSADRSARRAWLQDLRGWFAAHRAGPDALVYAAARAAAVPSLPVHP